MKRTFYIRAGKRLLDVSCALAGLILLAPVFAIVAVAIKSTSKGAIFYRQERLGKLGHPFRIWKFRTMVEHADGHGPLVTAEGDSRITLFGRWLRRTKVDELPQLLNVLAGEMSLVGPRPEVTAYIKAYAGPNQLILLAKPGITGPAANFYLHEDQLLAGQPDKSSFYLSSILPRKLELDLQYCGDIRFATDVRWIGLTFASVLEKSLVMRRTALRPADK